MLIGAVGKAPVPVMLEELNGGKGVNATLGAVPVDGTTVELEVG